ncbi:50S ribosomal protein L4 [Euryarchaeota archaeon ex4484_162]|nr:50S ribosomal protein L4 [Thermoplasmata archaeon]OYT58106.1 MAG: 50S ribosomal protein L4 [Euryarchaeota archaeon ex4484_162]RLF30677.1 MAG: 50S ribosomal protein L4 [Thermoplasmata archaeon]RLF62266.1 MAG: 50S ribosomal protein L4 [Thermoplasmata archaeon]
MKVNIYDLNGEVKNKIELPDIFSHPVRPDVIKKAFDILRANKRQPYGVDPTAGKKHATASAGKGLGVSRVPRLTQIGSRRAALAPGTVGGRRAHPPKAEKNWKEKINKKEKQLAIKSALSATKDKNIVKQRGHRFDEKITLPIIIENKFKNLKKTKEVIEVLKKLKVYEDIKRAEEGKHIRAGKGKRRGRKYKIPKSILIISNKGDIHKSASNIPGLDVITPDQINIEHLAPGGNPGRLTIFTEEAIKQIGGK